MLHQKERRLPYLIDNQQSSCFLLVVDRGAEGGGFEPPVREPVRQFSKLLVSATHPSFQKEALSFNRGVISLIAGAKVLHFSETSKSFQHFFRKKLLKGDDGR